jgi:N-acetylmuramoyl-L-alanine amidase
MIAFVLAVGMCTPLSTRRVAAAGHTVCVDAGHGGTDSGAAYGGLLEKNLTLDIATRLQTLLQQAGYGVVMTRTGDQSLGNTDRANICNAGGTDTVVAIHLNAASDPNVDYFKAFYGKQNKDRALTQTLWDTYTLDIPKSPISQFASGLLLKTNAPAALVETVFLSNPREQQLLADGTGNRQQTIAQQLFNGLQAWYSTHP